MCQISSCFPKVERYYMSKELTWDKRPNKSHIHISWLPQNLYPSPKQHLATVLAVWAETDLSVNGQNSFSSGLQVVGVVGFIPTSNFPSFCLSLITVIIACFPSCFLSSQWVINMYPLHTQFTKPKPSTAGTVECALHKQTVNSVFLSSWAVMLIRTSSI